jgi:mono/diheme cytochrome c family protein
VKFIAGFVTAIVLLVVVASLVTLTGAYNVAATISETGLERIILRNVMFNSVRAHSDHDVSKTWNEDQVQEGFQEYNEMCVYCHGAPGREASDIGRGLRPSPPNLVETAQRWSDSQLFWIVKNGIKMTGMPAFAPTHADDTIWNIVGFVRRLPHLTAEEYSGMEEHSTESHEHDTESHEHHH